MIRWANTGITATKADFEVITSIHIYSLEPGPIEVWTP
jgi:hypothetical protein